MKGQIVRVLRHFMQANSGYIIPEIVCKANGMYKTLKLIG